MSVVICLTDSPAASRLWVQLTAPDLIDYVLDIIVQSIGLHRARARHNGRKLVVIDEVNISVNDVEVREVVGHPEVNVYTLPADAVWPGEPGEAVCRCG